MKTPLIALCLVSTLLVGCEDLVSNNTNNNSNDNTNNGNTNNDTTITVSQRVNPTDVVRGDAPELAALGSYSTGITTLTVTNPNQVDVANTTEEATPLYDRTLTLEIWYPAEAVDDEEADRTTLVYTRNGETTALLQGRASRDATPLYEEGPFPLILLSHGYPGNRYLMSHFGENLATKGFVVASIDHMESTYNDQGAFVSTLLNRSLDHNFVLQEMASLTLESGFFGGLIDADNSGIIGYSMGGYGALNTVGAGLADGVTSLPLGTPAQLAQLNQRKYSDLGYQSTVDTRFKAIIAIGPWGAQLGFWDAAGLGNVQIPVMIMAGSIDDVSNYDGGIRNIYNGLTTMDRSLLTFIDANHNAAAPIAAPWEVYVTGEGFDHYADAVWDNTRMNNIAQHFATAFFELHLKGNEDRRDYLTLAEEYAADGVEGDDEEGIIETTWKGFNQRDAVGLRFEYP